MNTINYTDTQIAARIWLSTAMVFAGGGAIIFLFSGNIEVAFGFATLGLVVAGVASLPALLTLYAVVRPIMKRSISLKQKYRLLILTCFLITLVYALLLACMSLGFESFFKAFGIFTCVLFGSALCAIAFNHKAINSYFLQNMEEPLANLLPVQPNTTNVEQQEERPMYEIKPPAGKHSERK